MLTNESIMLKEDRFPALVVVRDDRRKTSTHVPLELMKTIFQNFS
jgi:hypothetical protein